MSSDIADTAAKYCPACGSPVSQSQSLNAEDSIFESGHGVYKKQNAHVVVEGAIVSIYVHMEGES